MSNSTNNSDASLTRKWGEGWIEGVSVQYVNGTQTYPAGTRASVLKHDSKNDYNHTKIKAIYRMSSVNRVGMTLRKENYIKMGEDISKCTSLRTLCIVDDTDFNGNCAAAIFDETRTYHCPLLMLDFSNTSLARTKNDTDETRNDKNGIVAMCNFIRSTPTLNYLDLSDCGINDMDINSIASALSGSSKIQELYLKGNNIGGYGIKSILNTNGLQNLTKLQVHDQHNIYHSSNAKHGRDAIVNYLKQDGLALVSCTVDCKDAKYAKRILESLSKDSKLVRINHDEKLFPLSEKSRSILTPVLKKLICDTSSFDSLCQSNHNLHTISCDTNYLIYGRVEGMSAQDYQDLRDALTINKRVEDCNTHQLEIPSCWAMFNKQRLRCKLRCLYFKGEFSLDPFIDLDVNLMPYLLELVTRTEVHMFASENEGDDSKKHWFEVNSKNLDGVYRIIRNSGHIPDLFSFISPEKKISTLEADNAALKKEVEELRAQLSILPSKRLKASS